jgi:hypothetical protein
MMGEGSRFGLTRFPPTIEVDEEIGPASSFEAGPFFLPDRYLSTLPPHENLHRMARDELPHWQVGRPCGSGRVQVFVVPSRVITSVAVLVPL